MNIMEAGNIIEVNNLSKTFQVRQKQPGLSGALRSLVSSRWKEVQAVKGISFTVSRGELLAFIGPNGAGKSTTIKMLTGILYPSGGEATVLGLTPWRDRRRLAYRVGTVFGQKSQLWYHLPPLDTFELLARIYELDRSAYRRRRDTLVEAFELGDYLHTPVRKLSLGQRMRCEIAASLLHRPDVIFLDEPTIGLDVVARQVIRDLIRQANREDGTTIFLTSHDAGDIEQLCKRVLIINHGQVILDGSVSALRRDYLKSKVVDLRLDGSPDGFSFPGVEILKASPYGLKLLVDTERQGIEAVLAHLVGNYRVLDITISDPPLEKIIAEIYRAGEGGGPPAAG